MCENNVTAYRHTGCVTAVVVCADTVDGFDVERSLSVFFPLNNYLHSKEGANGSLRHPLQTTAVVSMFEITAHTTYWQTRFGCVPPEQLNLKGACPTRKLQKYSDYRYHAYGITKMQ